jgi:copper chaperone CopZ
MMKYVMQILAVGLFVVASLPAWAQYGQAGSKAQETITLVTVSPDTSVTFMVYGNCGMCKRRIVGAMEELEGIHTAAWSTETKMADVTYDSKLVSLDEIQKKIAEVGHDTGKYRAEESVYNDLPGCCQYDRAKD